MLKKLVSLVIAVACFASFAVNSFATETEVTEQEIIANGTLISSEIIETEEGDYKKEIYNYRKETTTARSLERSYEETVMCTMTPLSTTTDQVDAGKHGAIYMTVFFTEHSVADDYNDQPGYRITRVTCRRTSDDIGFIKVFAIRYSRKAGFRAEYAEVDVSTATGTSVLMTPGFEGHIADSAGAKLGASMGYSWRGEVQQEPLECWAFNNEQ